MTYSPTSLTSTASSNEEVVNLVSDVEAVSVASSSSTSTSSLEDTDNYSPTSPSGGSAMVEDPETTFWAETAAATVSADAAFERHGLYFVRMHRAYHLLGVLMIARSAAGASRDELMQISNMRNDAWCEARVTLTLVRAAARQSGRRP
eukprot:9561983-Heterocapsa_arctica.AAC.2